MVPTRYADGAEDGGTEEEEKDQKFEVVLNRSGSSEPEWGRGLPGGGAVG